MARRRDDSCACSYFSTSLSSPRQSAALTPCFGASSSTTATTSVYGRILNGNDALEKHYKRLGDNLPSEGSVRCLSVTEKQFASMKLLVGLPLFQEKAIKANQMLLF